MYFHFVHFNKLSPSTITKIVLVLCAYILFPVATFAATFSFRPTTGSYDVGTTFTVGVYVDSSAKALNAVSGVISYPQESLEVVAISKNQSVMSLWVQEPSFSNSAGTARFEGIVLNPGFIGSSGKVLSVTFKAKAPSTPLIAFSSGSALANDGEGTEILTSKGTAQFTLRESVFAASEVPVESESPIIKDNQTVAVLPKITSSTHPENMWSSKTTGVFAFDVSPKVTALRLLLDGVADSVPSIVYEPPITSREIVNLKEGTSYLHVQYKIADRWSDILHYKLQIDTQVPETFVITEVGQGVFTFNATDLTSPVNNFEVQVDGGTVVTFVDLGNHIFSVPPTTAGTHTLFVKAYDAAQNYISAKTDFTIQAIPEEVKNEVPQTSHEMIVAKGMKFVTVLSVVVPLVALILLLAALLYYVWCKIGGLRKRIDKEVLEARMIVHKAFSILRNDLQEDIATLKKANEKRKLTKEESKILKRLQKNIDEAEKVISKEVLDIEKQIR